MRLTERSLPCFETSQSQNMQITASELSTSEAEDELRAQTLELEAGLKSRASNIPPDFARPLKLYETDSEN